MATELWVDSSAGSDANAGTSSGLPKRTVQGCADADGVLPGDVTINFVAGTPPIDCDTRQTSNKGTAFRGPANGYVRLRATGGGSRPQLRVGRCGIKVQGAGDLSVQDVDLFQDTASADYGTATALESRTGGGAAVSNSEIRGFFTSVKCGTGIVALYRVKAHGPVNAGFLIDAAPTAPVGIDGYIRECIAYANDPQTNNDLLVLHDGGYGIRTGWLIEDCRVEAAEGTGIETGVDIQQAFRGVVVRRNTIIRPTQWGFSQGSLFQSGVTVTFDTRSQMLAHFTREGTGSNAGGQGVQSINGGHCAWVTADGAKNGLYQLTGDDPASLGAWTGPLTADDMLTNPSLYYQNTLVGSGAGMHLRHPGTEFCGNTLLDISLGDYTQNGGGYGGGQLLHVYDMGYGCKVYGNVYQTTSGKYRGAQSGQLETSNRSFITIDAINSRIAQRTRVKARNNVFRMRAEHTGPFIEFKAAADHGYLDSDYNAWIRDEGVSDADKPNFSLTVSTPRTYTAYKAANGGSDAHSQWRTHGTALIDTASRPLDGSTLIGAGQAWSGLDADMPLADVAGTALSSPPEIGAYTYITEADQAAVVGTLRRQLRTVSTQIIPPGGTLPPDVVTGLAEAAGTATASSLFFTWDADPQAVYYELRYVPVGMAAWTTYASTFSAAAGEIAGLAPATGYDVQARAVNGAGQSDWCAAVTAATA